MESTDASKSAPASSRTVQRSGDDVAAFGDPYAVVSLPVSEERLSQTVKRLARVWSQIEESYAKADFPTRTSRLCDWCWFQDFCPAFAGSFEEAAAAAERKGVPV